MSKTRKQRLRLKDLKVTGRKYDGALRNLKRQVDKLCAWGVPTAAIYFSLDNSVVTYGASNIHDVVEKHKEELLRGSELDRKELSSCTATRITLPILKPGLEARNFQAMRDLALAVVRADKGGIQRQIGWGIPENKPKWWPDHIPWTRRGVQAGINRTQLQELVREAYKYHGQESSLNSTDTVGSDGEPDDQDDEDQGDAAVCDDLPEHNYYEDEGNFIGQIHCKSEIHPGLTQESDPTTLVSPDKPSPASQARSTPRKRPGRPLKASTHSPKKVCTCALPVRTKQVCSPVPVRTSNAHTPCKPMMESCQQGDVPISSQRDLSFSTPCEQIGDAILPIPEASLNQTLSSKIRTVHLPAEKEIIILIADSGQNASEVLTTDSVLQAPVETV